MVVGAKTARDLVVAQALAERVVTNGGELAGDILLLKLDAAIERAHFVLWCVCVCLGIIYTGVNFVLV